MNDKCKVFLSEIFKNSKIGIRDRHAKKPDRLPDCLAPCFDTVKRYKNGEPSRLKQVRRN
jgi:hypothetical protein